MKTGTNTSIQNPWFPDQGLTWLLVVTFLALSPLAWAQGDARKDAILLKMEKTKSRLDKKLETLRVEIKKSPYKREIKKTVKRLKKESKAIGNMISKARKSSGFDFDELEKEFIQWKAEANDLFNDLKKWLKDIPFEFWLELFSS
ncbi:MAG: hypothetical protein OEY56_10440 [Cyclobacteriaceae bacterium]|nr:hypothetical protein [Cyclobacteriaceae bacterium]